MRLKEVVRWIKHKMAPYWYVFKYGISLSEIANISVRVQKGDFVKIVGIHYVCDVSIGDYTYISKNAYISKTKIGKYCSIGPNLLCGWGIHPINGVSTSPMFYSTAKQNGYTVCRHNKINERKPIFIGNDVFIGANVTILDGVTIGDGAVIGAGAVVSKDIPPYAVAVGCPIKIIKYRFDSDTIKTLLNSEWWNQDEVIIHKLIEQNFFNITEFIMKLENEK